MIHAAVGQLRAPLGLPRAARALLAVAALALLASGCGRLGHADADQPRAETVAIVRAVDGDTVRLAGSGDASRLRLIGQDTPETHEPGPERRVGPESSDDVSPAAPPTRCPAVTGGDQPEA